MNQRILSLFMKFLGAWGQGFTYEMLAEEYHVSTRTIRYDLQRIDSLLQEHGLPSLQAMEGGGLGLCGSREELTRAAALVAGSDFYAYKLSPGERRNIIMLILLNRDGPVTLGELADELCYSRGTIAKDMEAVGNFLAEYQLQLDESKTRGYHLLGREQDKRRLIIKDIVSNQQGIFSERPMAAFDNFALQEFPELETSLELLKELLTEREERYGITFTDDDFHRVLLYLAVTVQRSVRGYMPERAREGEGMPDGLSMQMAEDLLEGLGRELRLEFCSEEVNQLARNLHSRRLFSGHDRVDGAADLYLVVRTYLSRLAADCGVDFARDPRLQMLMVNHIRGIRQRMESEERFPNPYKEQLCREYQSYYAAICRHIGLVEDYLGCTIDEDERTFLLSHIAASAERYTDKRDIRAVVVCNAGLATANYLAEKLRRYFNLVILDVVSSHRAKEAVTPEDCDLVVSTVPVEIAGVICVTVTPMLTDLDADTIQKAIISIHRGRGKQTVNIPSRGTPWRRERVARVLSGYVAPDRVEEAADRVLEALELSAAPRQPEVPADGTWGPWQGTSFSAVLDWDHILLDVDAPDWQAALRCSAAPLVRSGEISERYVDAIIRIVRENGPYFVFAPGAALAHAAPEDGVNKPCVTLVRLKHPVPFGHSEYDPVQFVVVLGIMDAQAQIKVLFQIMNTLCDTGALNMLARAESAGEVLKILERLEEGHVPEQ